jgi:hypothetical protein
MRKKTRPERPKNNPAAMLPATEAEFNAAYKAADSATNIYEWDGMPQPGFYRQGGTLLRLTLPDETGCVGCAVQG